MKLRRLLPVLLMVCIFTSVFTPAACALEAPSVTAAAVVLADLDSGNILYEKNMNLQRSPASLTKIMTGLLAIEAVERGEIALDDIVTAPSDCMEGLDLDSSNAEIVPGEQMTFQDYLYCALVKSANEACNVIAVAVCGNIQSFISRMNLRAMELGAANTYFSDTNGLSANNHYTTAYDLFLITREAMKHELFEEIINTLAYEIPATNTHAARTVKNSNALICQDGPYGDDYIYPWASGVKTGYTRAAGYCLVSTAEKNDVHLLAVVLGCHGLLNTGDEKYGNFTGTINLYDWGFRNFAYRDVITYGDAVTQLPVSYAKDNAPVTLRAAETKRFLLPKETEDSDIKISINADYSKLVAPIAAGTVLGTADIIISGNKYATVPLANAEAIDIERSAFIRARLEQALAEPWIRTTVLILAGIAFLYLFLMLRYRAIRKRHLRARQEAEDRRRRQREMEENLAKSRQAQEEMMEFRKTAKNIDLPENAYNISSIDPAKRNIENSDISRLFK